MRKTTLFWAVTAVTASVACSGNDASDPTPSPSTGTGGSASGAGGSAAGGAGTGGTGVSSAGSANGGATNVPPGQLTCGGTKCFGGGHCDAKGLCPAFLSDCFASTDGQDTCDVYCKSQGYLCAEKGCGMDGTALPGGFTWTSFSAAHKDQCPTAVASDHSGQSSCGGVIWLSLPADEVVRCCCVQ